ncbi:MAG: insulinase family protein [Bacteroidales bacterium]|nr:insulinase family protein [Bacteroidales bacterium]
MGVRFAYKNIKSPVAYCALSIGAGTRDEEKSENGLAHFTEHMIFKGTKQKSAKQINNLLEKCGGELNAYTTKEETVVHATVLKEDLPKAIELLHDITFNSVFPEKEFIKERDIILEEIKSYKDTPSELIYDDYDILLFGEHPLSMPILGVPSTVRHIRVDNIKSFTSEYYTPENMTFSIVADLPEEKCHKIVDKYFTSKASERMFAPDKAESLKPISVAEQSVVIPKKTHQAHCIIGCPAYSLYDEGRVALSLLTNILGGPAINSRLNQILREKHGLVYTVDASYTPYKETGIFTIYFGTDKGSLEKASDLVLKELRNMTSSEISSVALKSAKKQLLGQLAISMNNPENQCLSMGKSLLVYNKIDSIEVIGQKIEAVTPAQIHRISCEMFSEERMRTLIYR